MYVCSKCGQTFTRSSARKRHATNSCKYKDKIPINIVKRVPKVPMEVKLEEFSSVIGSLQEEIKQLREEKMKPQQVYQQVNNYNIVVSPDAFGQLVNKYGKDTAISILTQKTTTEVAKKLYFAAVKPDQYPIACRNQNHFRYINDKHEIIDDLGGDTISDMVSTNVKNAMITAANEVISAGTGINNVTEIQTNLARNTNTDHLMDDLAQISFNPSHPFFRCN